MIIFSNNGSIFLDPHDAVICPVNCLGVMGKGLAADFRKRFPYHCKLYEKIARAGNVGIGSVLVIDGPDGRVNYYNGVSTVIFFPTKLHWKDPSQMEYVTEGLNDLAIVLRERKFKSTGIPALGCGLGGLNWSKVAPEITNKLGHMDCAITVYGPR